MNRGIDTDLNATISYYREEINRHLDSFLANKVDEAARISPYARDVILNAREYTLRGGKRLRPIFFIYGYKCISDVEGDAERAIIDASISIELMQSYLLIHDDIMDEDELRRGKPTFHVLYRDICEREFGPGLGSAKSVRYGENMAILTGDLLEAYGEEVLASSSFNAEYVRKALCKYLEIVRNVGYGQIMDITSEMQGSITEDEILMIHQLKTASYTIEGPLQIGAILAGAGDSELQVMREYGIPLGIAFQVQDDILGLFGMEDKIGKPVGSDIREGKKTLLIMHALSRCTEEERRFILRTLGNPHLTMDEIEAVREIVVRTGSLDYSRKLVRENTERAKRAMIQSNFRPEAREFLIKIADFIGDREY